MNFWPFCNILHGLSFCKRVITLTPILRITNYITCQFNATIWKTLEHKTEKHKLCSWQPIFLLFLRKRSYRTYHRIRSIKLLTHNPWNTSILWKSHFSSPQSVSFTSFSISIFIEPILIFHLQIETIKLK